MSENRKITLRAEDYKVFFSAIGALEVAAKIVNDEGVESPLRTCASVFIQRMCHALDNSVFSLMHELDKDEAVLQIAHAWTDIELEIRKRSVVARVVVDADGEDWRDR